MKIIKVVGISIIVLLLVLVSATGALLLLVNPNDFKPELEQLAAKKQFVLTLDGDLSWQLFPRLGITSGPLSLLPPLQAIASPIAFERMSVAIKVPALLRGEIVAANVEVEGGALSLRSDQGQHVKLAKIQLRGVDLNTQSRIFPFALAFDLQISDDKQQTPKHMVTVAFESDIRIDSSLSYFSLIDSKTSLQYLNPTIQQPWPVDIALSAKVDSNKQILTMENLQFSLFSFQGDLNVKANIENKKSRMSGHIKLTATDINTLLNQLGQAEIPVSDAAALQKMMLKSDFVLNNNKLSFNDLNIQLDDSLFQGRVNLQLSDIPVLDVSLAGTEIDIDRYLPQQKMEKKPSKKETSKSARQESIPFSDITTLPGNYQLSLEKVKVNQLNVENIELALSVSKQGLMEIKTAQADLYDGHLTVGGYMDTRISPPSMKLTPSLTSIQLEPLFVDLQSTELEKGESVFAAGDMAFQGRLITQGMTEQDLLEGLNGSLSFQSTTMVLNEIDLSGALDQSLLQLLKMELPNLINESETTVMNNLIGEAHIVNGTIDNHTLRAQSLCTQFSGSGQFNLVQETLQYNLGIVFPSLDKTAACQEINSRLKDVSWPLQCQGRFDDDPSQLCGVNKKAMDKALKNILGKEAKRKFSKELDKKILEELDGNEEVKDLLKGLFR